MSFRRRNVGITSSPSASSSESDASRTGINNSNNPSTAGPSPSQLHSTTRPDRTIPGTRPSPLDGRPTTSTGTRTLDGLLAGHAGLPLGASLLIEESGTTDYAGALVRFFAAEGLVQRHPVYVLGAHERWGRELPGLVGGGGDGDGAGREEKRRSGRKGKEGMDGSAAGTDRMKIAWRYEQLVQGEGSGMVSSRDVASKRRENAGVSAPAQDRPFCHVFDLRKRLEHPPDSSIIALKLSQDPGTPIFTPVLEQLNRALAGSPDIVHRLVIPSLFHPQAFPPVACLPHHVLQFLKGIRALSSLYPHRLVVMITLPLSLFPRSSALVRWIELLSDGVIELAPFPHSHIEDDAHAATGKALKSDPESDDGPPQGLLKTHRLPIFHERGIGTGTDVDDWAFTLSRRRFCIKPYSLPPIEGDNEAQQASVDTPKMPKKAEMEF